MVPNSIENDNVLVRSALGMPPLPSEIEEIICKYVNTSNKWLDAYVEYASTISPLSPKSFHQSAGLTVLSAVIARRVKAPMAYADVYPNLYVIWVAPTTVYRKSTAQRIANDLLHDVCPHLMIAQDTTPEAMITCMAGTRPSNYDSLTPQEQDQWEASSLYAGQKVWVLDEFSGFMNGTTRKYNNGQLEIFLKFYDCPDLYTRQTQKDGLLTVDQAYPVMLTASTPSALKPYLSNPTYWSNGWWPRFVMITPEDSPEWRNPVETKRPAMLEKRLRELNQHLPQPDGSAPLPCLDAILTQDVLQAFECYSKIMTFDMIIEGSLDDSLSGVYGRMPTHVLKIATILATIEWDGHGDIRIEMHHFAQALRITEGWRESVHRLLRTQHTNDLDKTVNRVVSVIAKADDRGVTVRDIEKATGLLHETVEQAVKVAVDTGRVEKQSTPPGAAQRPTNYYHIKE